MATYPTALYRLYAADETLLYVGITLTPGERFTTHARTKAWWPSVARKAVEWYGCRIEAMAAETLAIAAGNPVHNSVRPRRVRIEYMTRSALVHQLAIAHEQVIKAREGQNGAQDQ